MASGQARKEPCGFVDWRIRKLGGEIDVKTRGMPACVGLILLATASALAGPASDHLVGGYATAPLFEKDVADAAAFAVAAQAAVLRTAKGGSRARLALVQIVGAERQVVAGMNYRLTLKVLLNGEARLTQAVVWRQAWRKPRPDQLTSWIWR